jgi:hypothetical protein
MKRLSTFLAASIAAAAFAAPAFAGYTLFDTAKDSMFVGKGEFVALQRTPDGDRLTLRVSEWLKGEMPGASVNVVIEPFDKAYNDAAIGQKAIVGFNQVNGKFYTPFASRSIFLAHENLAACEDALRGLCAINKPYDAVIKQELRKRLEYRSLAYEGDFSGQPELLAQWREELIRHTGLVASDACRDALKCFWEHEFFKNTLTRDEKARIAKNLPRTSPGVRADVNERSFMILLLREDKDLLPDIDTQFRMLAEEVADFNVSRLAETMQHFDRGQVLARLGEMLKNRELTAQQRDNAALVLLALKDKKGLPLLREVLASESTGAFKPERQVVRRVLMAMREIPDASNTGALEAFLATDFARKSREFRQHAIAAYAMVDSAETNKRLGEWLNAADNDADRAFFRNMLDKERRAIVVIHREDRREADAR